jgi:hypothetical protein
MRILRQSSATAGICGLLILLLVCPGCGNPPSQPTTSRTQASTPTIAGTATSTAISTTSYTPPTANGPLGPVPTNCPASPPLQTMTQNNFGGGFIGTISFQGGSPAWQLGLGSDGIVHLHPSREYSYSSTKVMWVVGPNYAQVVTLSGHDVQTGALLWFEIYPSNDIIGGGASSYTTQAQLDPAAPNRGSTDNSTGHWNIWGIGIIALTAGCYELDVTWSGGGWQAIYAIGS